MANGDINGALVDFTLENVNGHNGYSHGTINGVVDMVKDKGKEVVGKTINGDTVTSKESKKRW